MRQTPTCVERDEERARLARAFYVLGSSTRLHILEILLSAEERDPHVEMITGRLNLTQPTVSHHLKILMRAGLVNHKQQGLHHHYRVNRQQMAEMSAKVSSFVWGKVDIQGDGY
jgi:ArsR family transcriptional regulator, arsenate/arsenite/antimonite-responsive transcriptional repressor